MRAREFITEQAQLPAEEAGPLRYTYELPGLSTADPYRTYRMGVAIARARSDAQKDDNVNPFKIEWSPETALGKYAVVAGVNDTIDPIIDRALKMSDTPGGKKMVSTPESTEPEFVDTTSPLRPFRGYPR